MEPRQHRQKILGPIARRRQFVVGVLAAWWFGKLLWGWLWVVYEMVGLSVAGGLVCAEFVVGFGCVWWSWWVCFL